MKLKIIVFSHILHALVGPVASCFAKQISKTVFFSFYLSSKELKFKKKNSFVSKAELCQTWIGIGSG